MPFPAKEPELAVPVRPMVLLARVPERVPGSSLFSMWMASALASRSELPEMVKVVLAPPPTLFPLSSVTPPVPVVPWGAGFERVLFWKVRLAVLLPIMANRRWSP